MRVCQYKIEIRMTISIQPIKVCILDGQQSISIPIVKSIQYYKMLLAIAVNIDTDRSRIRQPFIHLFVIRTLNNQHNLSIVNVCIEESLDIRHLSIRNSLTCVSH